MLITTKVKSIFGTVCTIIALSFSPAEAIAQQPAPQQMAEAKSYSEAELKKFVKATMDMQKVQMEFQQQMSTAIQKEGIDAMKFNEMAQAQQTGSDMSSFTEEEQGAFANAMKSVMIMQQGMQSKVQTTLESHDMSFQEYQTMAMAIQQSPEMAEKVKSMMQG